MPSLMFTFLMVVGLSPYLGSVFPSTCASLFKACAKFSAFFFLHGFKNSGFDIAINRKESRKISLYFKFSPMKSKSEWLILIHHIVFTKSFFLGKQGHSFEFPMSIAGI